MGFDVEKFQATSFVFREEAVPVPKLKDFFGEGEEPVWKVRNLTGEEVFVVNEAKERNDRRNELIEGVAYGQKKERIEAIKEMAGNLPEMAPSEYVRRLEMLTIASVDPMIQKETAIKLANFSGEIFTHLTNRILVLTGLGKEPGK
ncbi:MAG: hypothetical protein JXI32_01880 [Deltaproteobacteria bacterium]|nr:hypothetical protein [Deltaproteobacteria bacterium]